MAAPLPLAEAQRLHLDGEMPSGLVPGERGQATVRVVLEDPERVVDEGVLFFNVVVDSREQGWPQAAHKIFASASEHPSVFRRVVTAAELREGIAITVNYEVRRGAPLGDYVFVIQLFAGRETNPHRVRLENRIALIDSRFSITPLVTGAEGNRP